MKVFDIVKVVTNGNFGTQVLANDMYNQAFSDQQHRPGLGPGRSSCSSRSCR